MIPIALGLGGPYDIAIIAGVVLLLFGGSKLAGLGKSLGLGIKDFKSAVSDVEDDPLSTVVPVGQIAIQEVSPSPKS